MGYLGNHLATLVMGTFAAILTGLWPYFVDFAPILEFTFIVVVPISWFLTVVLWVSQKSNDYMHKHAPMHSEKKSLSNTQTIVTTTTGSQISLSEIKQVQNELSSELNGLKESVKLKDSEIERLIKKSLTYKLLFRLNH